MNTNLIRKLPKIDEVISTKEIKELLDKLPHKLVLDTVRKNIDEKRKSILAGDDSINEESLAFNELIPDIIRDILNASKMNLTPVVNATGVSLHTNLGRAKLSEVACNAVVEVAKNYSTLEYNVNKGARGSRHDHVEKIIKDITGAEAAMIVNNNAAATMLCLSALGNGHEVIVSRGEIVEIGGSFRVSEIMEQSGAQLVEVGTTNKTRISDYENHITENTAALMKVHTSNYKIMGFTEDVSLDQLVKLGKEKNLPVIYDMGSGLMCNLDEYGIEEPTVLDSLKSGIDVILFSGDKLLGGPQGGIIVGKKSFIDMMKQHPLARVVRVDKMTLAAMESTFRQYYDMETAMTEIPVLASLTKKPENLYQECEKLIELIKEKSSSAELEIEKIESQVGGGSAPTVKLPGYGVSVMIPGISCQRLERLLRKGETPIIARVAHDRVILDVRTVAEIEMGIIASRLGIIANEQESKQ